MAARVARPNSSRRWRRPSRASANQRRSSSLVIWPGAANRAPKLVRDIAEVLPLKYVVDGLSGAMVTGKGVSDNLTALAVIAVWAALGIVLAVRGFSWEARRT